MTFRRALELLEARQETRIELGLSRVRRHLARLGDPQEKVPCFHVAGTNGKGSTCAILASVLRAAGYRVGLYTSPHLLDVRERIRVNGEPISRADFAKLMPRDERLTYFELLTVLAFKYFAEKKCDVMVLETGLGGRLDATNVVRAPLAAVVTSISFDHEAFLGSTLRAIAREKAGIFKAGRPAVSPDIPQLRPASRGRRIIVRRPWNVELPLRGEKQRWNAALARAAVDAAGIAVSDGAWRRGLAAVKWPGRFDVIKLGPKTLIVDGAHNPEASAALAATWKGSRWSRRPARWIIGIMRDKDAEGVLRPLARFLENVVLVRPPSPRALDAFELAAAVRRVAPRARITVEHEPAKAIAAWRRDPRAPKVAVCAGSLYLAGAALAAAGRRSA